ncbi:hypothetical protein TGAM01_v203286 [Trichoderma gamsii]|uniref:Uncharacterized protein n=1 Tax=Trichoderma gamsii TaxID=398673 RepID=A0A2P4ZTA5_9HYPO|nr:hypothetical protein TGAM01_v203286 [Trichoderma gamsii]PON27519.1 hypothetical protein TGAM01_v203286 [Trichoderma gamsii]
MVILHTPSSTAEATLGPSSPDSALLPNASPRPVSDAAPARTAAAVSPSASPPKTRPSVPLPTRSLRASSSPPTTSPRSTSPSRARLDPVVIALWAMLSAATAAHMSDYRRSSLVKKSGC